jgi:uncharacterized protein YndB with AHSA1/START domain/predicted SnoaL-like aldol condensation-catalyzing enzyme
MTAESTVSVRVTRRFTVSAQRVFDAWLDPKRAGKWLFATPTGQMVRVDIDARVGGSFRFVDRRDGEDVEHVGEYLEIDRPRRLVFTLSVPKYSPNQSRVTVEIAPHGTGCELTLTDERVPRSFAGKVESGWATVLDQLAALDSRKEAAVSFLRMVGAGDVRDAYRRYIAPGFRHHNPFFRGDAESLLHAMEENAAQNPDKVVEVQRALEDGDLVAVHSRVQQKPGDPGAATVHIFRFEGDRVVELWDMGQPVPDSSPNQNGMF